MTISRLEELSLNAWPALQTLLYDGWILRFADGYTKRANSVNPLYASYFPLDDKIAYCESLYQAHRLPTVFKLTGQTQPPGLDEALSAKGYMRLDETSVQILDLREHHAIGPGITLHPEPDPKWLQDAVRLSGLNDADRRTLEKMLVNITTDACCISLTHGTEVVGCALSVREHDWVGLFDVIVAPGYRRRGFGRQIVEAGLHWGMGLGAQHAYLQVVVGNEPAWRLYRRIGFTEAYRYWYRRKYAGSCAAFR